MKKSKLLSLFMIVCIIVFILTLSVAVPIVIRPFYYLHIKPLGLERATGLSYDQIKVAYDEMMDFCFGLRSTFSTGVLSFTPEGEAHFVDVAILFKLDFICLALSTTVLVGYQFIKSKVSCYKFFNQSEWAIASKILLTFFICVVLFSLNDFTTTFYIFHYIFFPGKTNWLFDPRYDQIINILPEVFFRNCAICIVGVLVVICVYSIVKDYRRRYLGK